MSESDHYILGLDLGKKKLGWCLVKNAVVVNSGVVTLDFKDAHPTDPFIRFREFLQRWKGISEICYEDVNFHTSRDQSRWWDGMRALMLVYAYDNRCRVVPVPTGTLKKEFTGHGGKETDKTRMCEVAHRMGWKHGEPGTDLDHDEVDALAAVFARLKRQGTTLAFK